MSTPKPRSRQLLLECWIRTEAAVNRSSLVRKGLPTLLTDEKGDLLRPMRRNQLAAVGGFRLRRRLKIFLQRSVFGRILRAW